ncbi:outer membrane beta-barrel protein [Thermophagus sp. OGC60D27]|uniref:outer membrane beta-barrel protein n=1 Tax=Thermophagus sp. OGC60D27 TaxID=3458415 RepID=UPI004037ED98
MKKTFIILLLIGVPTLHEALGQDPFSPFYEVGIKASTVLSTAFISIDDEGSGFKGPGVGVRFLHMQTKNAGLLAEVNYSSQSFTSEELEYNYSFIHIPFMSRFRFPLNKRNDIALNIGSYLQLITDQDVDVVFDRSSLFGLAGGLDYGLMVGKMRVSVEGRYHYNLHSNSDDADNIRSSWLEVTLGLSFRRQKKN